MYEAQLVTFSPVHIGDGEELIPFEYIVEGNEIKVYPFYYFIDKLYETYPENEIMPKITILKEYARAGFIKDLKEYFATAKINLEPKYRLKLKNIKSGTNIKTFIKNLLGPYIPGSEIKGALRTVFIYGVLKENHELRKNFLNKLSEKVKIAKTKQNKKEKLEEFDNLLQEIEAEIFRAGTFKEQRDAKYDLFKAIQISDSEPLPLSALYVDGVRTLNTSQNLIEFNELFYSEKIAIKLSFTLDKKITLSALDYVGQLNSNFKINNIKKLTLDFLKQYALDFYENIINIDEEFVKNKVNDLTIKDTLLNQLSELKSYFQRARNSKKYIIPLRIGKHQGYLSLTIMQMVKQENSKLFEEVFKIAVPQWRAEINKTRKITLSEPKFLGWCFLVINAH